MKEKQHDGQAAGRFEPGRHVHVQDREHRMVGYLNKPTSVVMQVVTRGPYADPVPSGRPVVCEWDGVRWVVVG